MTPSSPGGIRPQRCSCRSCYLVSSSNVPCGDVCTGGNLQRLDPDRSFSLFSSAVRGTVLSWQSAKASALLPQPGHGEPLPCPRKGLGPGAGTAPGTATGSAALWVLLSISSSQDLAASNPRLYPEQKNWDQQELENNWALSDRLYGL